MPSAAAENCPSESDMESGLTGRSVPHVADPASDETYQWFCVRCQPKHEHIAAANIRSQLGIEIVCPRIRFRKETRRGVVWFVEALFPGYIFARFDFARDHRNVHYAHGVSCIVHFGDKYPTLDPETVADLREFDGQSNVLTVEPTLSEGDEVRIGEGAFRGLTATVKTLLPARERVKVLIEFLGRLTEVEVPSQALVREGHPVQLLDRIYALASDSENLSCG